MRSVSDGVLTDPDVTASYARDQAMLAPAGTPAAVVLPRSTADVVAVMQMARGTASPWSRAAPARGWPARATPSTARSRWS